ncbi:pyruvate, phosphate dikinase [Agrilactobacillus yilanensis]|uniref:Pyruvate, phosphate dikinase n=1 Tax=Agrilactobacillus yilanensis TaxID=2485997 RepID=A0ABW4J4R4_9LACO|nr:pyruvate, phosphate dikinase [Agrilactobacillus yilanensis]
MSELTYAFSEGNKDLREVLGGKGANLCEMTNLGLPVPQGFVISTIACRQYLTENILTDHLINEIKNRVQTLEAQTEKTFGTGTNPLLVSVRSGAKFSMPGMMDTILNLGLNDDTVQAVAAKTQNLNFAYQCYRRLIQMFGDVVFEIDIKHFNQAFETLETEKGYPAADFQKADWLDVIARYKEIFAANAGQDFPQNVYDQMLIAVEAVFKSWNNDRAKVYRQLHNIPEDLGTAVNIQRMVFGNYSETSGTGVMFTRNPVNGTAALFGEYLSKAQGEDIVSGARTPDPIADLEAKLPAIYQQLTEIATKLENHYKDMQDVEFTVEDGKLFMLQTRNGKRTPKAAVTIAYDLFQEKRISETEMILRIEPGMIDHLLHPNFQEDELANHTAIAKGLPASPGAAAGQIVFTAEDAKAATQNGKKVILLRNETSPEDIVGMTVSEAIITSHGGMTSHAAVVARGMGTCCVVGCQDLHVDEDQKVAKYNGGALYEGDLISVDGTSGKIYLGQLATTAEEISEKLNDILDICDKHARLMVRGNAETPKDIREAITKGAQGIGLARTEHMFFKPARLKAMRQLILADNDDEITDALRFIKGEQKGDFEDMYDVLLDRPGTIRLLDPPLHEFLPSDKGELKQLAAEIGKDAATVADKARALAEVNPMLGLRGVRLAVVLPQIYQMQVEAIMEAAIAVSKRKHITITPEIMIPLTGTVEEMAMAKQLCVDTATKVLADANISLNYEIGTMIENPRACIIADALAKDADFFSFGTNDLTQLTYGYSRDDAHKFLPTYLDKHLLPHDPFQVLDTQGVGTLIKMAATNGKAANKQLKVGVCGEVGGEPRSIRFLNTLPIDYVSCSPYRVPQARLICAISEIERQSQDTYAHTNA